jgi:protoporphyrinogen IX oxidase
MLWVKSFHIVFVASWFAGLFYLPRIFVNLAQIAQDSPAERARLLLMASKLFRFMTLLALPALGFGLWLWLGYGIGVGSVWLPIKLGAVAAALVFHAYCGFWLHRFALQSVTRSHVWFRWFNEIPVLLLLAAVLLVVIKPW